MLLRSFFQLLPYLKRTLVTALVLSFLLECLKLTPHYLVKVILDLLLSPEPGYGTVMGTISVMLLASLLTTYLEDSYITRAALSSFKVEVDILRLAHQKLLSLDLHYFENRPSGELVHLLTSGGSRLRDLMWFVQEQFFGAVFQLLLTTGILLATNLYVGMIFAAFMPLTLWLVVRTGRRVQPFRERYHGMYHTATWEMNQSLMNIRTVKDYVQEEKERTKYSTLLDEYFRLAKIRLDQEGGDGRVRDIVLGIGRFSVIGVATSLVFYGKMSPGSLVLFLTLSERVVASLFRLGRLYSYLGDSLQSIRKLSVLFQERPSLSNPETPLPVPTLRGEVKFNNVSFSYIDGISALEEVTLTIPAKSVCALVGRSGSGKSTLTKLVLRHYDVSTGSILLDKHDIRTFDVREYRRSIAVVSQDIELFDASVFDNIAYGLTASQEEVEEVARRAHAHSFISKLSEGYATRIGERGVKLSGGQKQRIGIARALLMRPSVLIFDEATSSLDTESEKQIQQAIQEISGYQTMIIVAHRLSTIESADMIVVLDAGRIAEVGTLEELLAKEGMFHRMRRLQSMGEAVGC